MNEGWKKGLRAAAFAISLGLASAGMAQDAAVAPASGGTTDTAVAVQSGATPAAGYVRSAPTPGIGQPTPKAWDLQKPMTPIAVQAQKMVHHVLNPIMLAICVLVLGLLLWAMIKFRSSAVAEPSRTTHNFAIEVIWTLVPALILLFIAFPSFKLLANQYNPPKADVTIKVTGYQWYWGYEYPDYGGISFESLPLSREDARKEQVPYLLDVDNRIVVPAGKTVKLLITGADVIHSFAVPSFWVKMDAVPGRVNETWFKADRPGVYYGQCSELCGTKHGFMPIAVEVVPQEKFLAWVRMKQAQDGIEPSGPGIVVPTVASKTQAANDLQGAAATAAAPASATGADATAPAPGAPAPATTKNNAPADSNAAGPAA